MTIREEFEKAFRNYSGGAEWKPSEEAFWAAKWMAEKIKKSMCKYCDCERPLVGNTHTWQVLTSKDKKGRFIYNPVQEECLSTPIRQLLEELDHAR